MILKNYTTPDDDVFRKESESKLDEVLQLETVYKYIDYNGGYAMLENSTLRFASPNQFNDPFDCYSKLIDYSAVTDDYLDCLIARYYSSYDRNKRREIKRELRRTTGIHMATNDIFRQNNKITCFTEEQNNLLMWAHYAKSYTGCCIGIDIQKLIKYLTDNEQSGGIEKVNYTQKFIPINFFRQPLRALSNWITTKSEEWSYEKEIRLFIFKEEGNAYWDLKIKDKSIFNKLYLGCQMEKNARENIIKLCSSLYPHLKIYDMKLEPVAFALKAELIRHS